MYLKWQQVCRDRGFNCPDNAGHLKERLDVAVGEVLRRHPEVHKVCVTGSYPKGGYVDSDTDEDFKALKKQAVGYVKVSDIDIITEPRIFDFFEHKGFKIHIVPHVWPGTPVVEWFNKLSHGNRD